jgi:RNA polymerase sigma-70 factor (ECF subfamily)
MNNSPETRHSLLLRLAQPNDLEAWQEFVAIYEPVVVRLAMRRGMQLSDAQDLCQEVLTRVAKLAETWVPDARRGKFRGWLARVARNLVIDHFRRNQRMPLTTSVEMEVLDGVGSTDPAASQFEFEERKQIFLRAAELAKGQFSEPTWQAFWRTSVENRRPLQVAEELQMTTGAVYVARSRVLASIRKIVEQIREVSLGEDV